MERTGSVVSLAGVLFLLSWHLCQACGSASVCVFLFQKKKNLRSTAYKDYSINQHLRIYSASTDLGCEVFHFMVFPHGTRNKCLAFQLSKQPKLAHVCHPWSPCRGVAIETKTRRKVCHMAKWGCSVALPETMICMASVPVGVAISPGLCICPNAIRCVICVEYLCFYTHNLDYLSL